MCRHEPVHRLPAAPDRLALSNVNPPRLVHEKFRFAVSEFSKNLAYKQVELDTGAVMTAPAEKLDDCFKATRASQWR